MSHKDTILAGGFNINLLDFDPSKKVQHFVNLMFRFGMIPTINKPTCVTRQTASVKKKDAKKQFTYKRKFSNQSIGTFKLRLCDTNWSKVRQCRNANEAHIDFFK